MKGGFEMTAMLQRILMVMLAAGLLATGANAYAVDRSIKGMIGHYVWRAMNKGHSSNHRLQVGDIELYYEVYGQGEPLLLLHGGTAFIESFFGQIPALSARYQVIVPDLRGHGRSTDSAAPLSYGLMADDIVGLMDALGIAQADVVGWSDGGIIGLEVAMRHPERLRRLVTIGSNYRVDGLLPDTLSMVQKLTPTSSFVARQGLFYRLVAPNPRHWPTLVEKIKRLWLSEPNFAPEVLQQIAAPTLVMVGEKDQVDHRHAREMAELIPTAQYVEIAGGTHLMPQERPGEVNRAILGFLGQDGG
jgi:pimeloyl-ACP methyl ester carboxylesterase